MIRVIAIAQGFDNVALREIGDEFDMPDDVFERRPRLDEKGQPIPNQYYEPPNWFEPVDRAHKDQVAEERKNTRVAAKVQAVDPVRQQADATAEARILAAAQEAVRLERKAIDDEETAKAVQKKVSELKNRTAVAGSDPRDTRGAENKTADFKGKPSPDNLDRSDTAKS